MSNLQKHKLDTLYEISSGISTKPEQYGHGAPFVSFSTIYNNYFIPDNLSELMDTSESEQKTYSVKKGDVFLTRTSETLDELAMSCVALKDYPQATFSGFAKRLRPIQDDITYDKFMGFFLRSKYFRKIIDNNAIMTLRASFNEKIFSYINVELPDYENQIKIGDLLLLLENKINLNKKINIELEKIAKTLYDYWFVQFDFPDENNKPYKSRGGTMVYNEALKQEIPINWEVQTLDKVCDVKYGKNFSNKDLTDIGYDVYGANGIIGKYTDYTHDKPVILVGCRGSVGNVSYTHGKVFITHNSLILDNLKIPFIYLYEYCKMFGFNNLISGSVQPQLTIDNIIKKQIIVPPKSLCNIYHQKMHKLVDLKIKNIIENNELIKIRNFLLPMLMNGQVTILDSSEDDLSEENIIKKSLEFWQIHGKMDIDQFARKNGILVYKDNEQKKGAVSYNAEKDLYEIAVKDPRDNFTIAHEIGHILKHKKELKNGTLGRKSEESGSKLMEYEADNLAAEILMPEEYVLKYMQDENKTDKEFLDEKFIKECAKHFDVNPPAMNIRLKNLGFKVPYLK